MVILGINFTGNAKPMCIMSKPKTPPPPPPPVQPPPLPKKSDERVKRARDERVQLARRLRGDQGTILSSPRGLLQTENTAGTTILGQ